MGEIMSFTQRSKGIRREFCFADDRLTYSTKGLGDTIKIFIPYEKIDLTSSFEMKTRKTPLANRMGQTVFLFGAILASYAFRDVPDATKAFGVLSAIVLAILYPLSHLTPIYTARLTFISVLSPISQNIPAIEIIHDINHDTIIKTINSKWKLRLSALYGIADVHGNHREELDRLQWLRNNGVIDENHFRAEVDRLTSFNNTSIAQLQTIN